MITHLRTLCLTLLILLATALQVSCDKCTFSQLEKRNGVCTAQLDCLHQVEFDSKTWECIKVVTNQYNSYYRRYENKITYNNTFNLIVHVKEPWTNISLATYETQCMKLVLENGQLTTVPQSLTEMDNLEELYIVDNNISVINLTVFNKVPKLNKIALNHNNISVIVPPNATAEVQSDSLKAIDLSHNNIEVLPDYFVMPYVKLLHLNLSHNVISSIDVLTFEAILTLQTLDLSHNVLQECGQALTRFSDLKNLTLAHNNITVLYRLNFENLSNLKTLNVSFNSINVIEKNTFQNLTKLTVLDLSYNNIINIYKEFFINNNNLHTLFLSNNNIQHIERNSFHKMLLQKFVIQNNKLVGALEEDTFKGINITDLNLSEGNLSSVNDFAFNGVPELINLNLSTNSISELSYRAFTNLESLTTLDLSYNLLEHLDIDSKNLTQLQKLFVRNNKIEKIIKNVFENFISLNEIDLSFNPLRVIEPSSFAKLKKLTMFNVTNCNFVSILDSKVLEGLSSITKLDMFNAKTTVFKNNSLSSLKALVSVEYTAGQLSTIEYNTFLGIASLQKLIFSKNQLQLFHVNTTTISQIEEIYLNHNLIRNITKETFDNLILLRNLNLANNEIFEISSEVFQNLHSLTHLDLSSNEEMMILGNPFYNLSNLNVLAINNVKGSISSFSTFANSRASVKILSLTSNGINDINNVSIFNVLNLKHLNLSLNELSSIDKDSFRNITTLVDLDLSLNKITYIQPGSFRNVKNLRNLNLSGNNIQIIQFGVFDGIEILRNLNLSDNIISTLDVKLLPNVSNLFLDNNNIVDFNFGSFLDTNLTMLSLGGNQLSCQILADLKLSNYSEKFSRVVTANPLNYHSENVDGIMCQSTTDIISPKVDSNNLTVPNNYNSLLASLINNIGKNIQLKQIVNNMNKADEKLNKLENTFEKLLTNFVDFNKNSQNKNNNYLHHLTKSNDNSNLQLVYIKNSLMQLLDNRKILEYNAVSTDNQELGAVVKNLQKEINVLRSEVKDALDGFRKVQHNFTPAIPSGTTKPNLTTTSPTPPALSNVTSPSWDGLVTQPSQPSKTISTVDLLSKEANARK